MAEIGNVTFRVDAVITDEQYREAMGAVRAANKRMDLLEAENAKLRELVADMWHELNYESVRAEDGNNRCLEVVAGFNSMMQELGIEVDR